MPGGWHEENATSEFISQLYDNAARLAGVRRGIVREAYAQVLQSMITYLFLLYRPGLPIGELADPSLNSKQLSGSSSGQVISELRCISSTQLPYGIP